ncbi:MAG TPA: cyanophycin synthetase, partial [Chitinivibrionales bacterium]
GLHNVKNACAALAVACELGIGVVEAATSLSEFSGVRRRFEVLGVGRGVTVIDDYAHHPTEIGATLSAARSAGYKKIIAVFQPHLYTRTRDFMNEFAQSLCTADEIIVTSIYKSREEPLSGVSAATIVEKIRGLGHTCCTYVEKKIDIAPYLLPRLCEGDAVIVMGAGDIWETAKQLSVELCNA